MTIGATLLAGAAAFAALVVRVAYEHSWQWDNTAGEAWGTFADSFDLADDWGYVLVTLLPVFMVFGAARRALNWIAVRRVFRGRGLCDWCGYVIEGLSVTGSGEVACPECSRSSVVAAVLGEPLEGAFVPNKKVRPQRYWTRRRAVRWVSAGVCAALGVAGVLAAPTGLRYWRVTRDAELALADRVTLEQFQRVAPTRPASSGVPSAVETIGAIKKSLDTVGERVTQLDPELAGSRFDPAFLTLSTLEPTEADKRSARYTGFVLDRWLAEDGPALLRALAGPLDFALKPRVDANGFVVDFNTGSLSTFRLIGRLCRELERRAIRAGDAEAWRIAAEAHVAVARAADQSPTMIGRLVSIAVEENLLDGVRERLFDVRLLPPGDAHAAAWLNAVETVLARRAGEVVPVDAALQGERLLARHTMSKVFADTAKVQEHLADERKEPRRVAIDGRIGRYAENREAIDRVYQAVLVEAMKRPRERQLPSPGFQTGLRLVTQLEPPAGVFLLRNDRSQQYLAAVATMVALEKHRQTTGLYPETLAALASPPVTGGSADTFADDGQLRYRRVEHSDRRPWYVLYGVGLDGKDNGGTATILLGDAFTSGGIGKDKDVVYTHPDPP